MGAYGVAGPDPDQAGDLAEYIGLLGELRIHAGQPSYRTLAKRVGPLLRPPQVVAASTVLDAFKVQRRRLDLDLVTAIVRALGVDEATVRRWRAACVRVHAGARKSASSGLRQLPADTRLFTGRGPEVDRLLALAAREGGSGEGAGRTVVVSAIDGMGGVGKSALAVHVAHRVRDRYPDGQLFLDLQGHTPGAEPLTPHDALDQLLRSLGTAPQQIPPDLAARAACYRDRLAGTRTLLVLDNAASTAQVRPLLPGEPDCLVLVTSRKQLNGLDDAHNLALSTLTPADGLALMREAAGPGRADEGDPGLSELVALCGYLPLAIRICAARLRHRPALRVEDLVEELQDEGHRLEALEDDDRRVTAVFDTSYAALSEVEQRVFRLLGTVPGPDFDSFAVANLLDTDRRSAQRLLESLVAHNLLAEPLPRRYRLHDLVRLYAGSLGRAPERAKEQQSGWERLLDYYQDTARNADRLLNRYLRPGSSVGTESPALPCPLADRAGALAWMRAECDNLLAAIAACGRDRPARAIGLTAAMSGFLHLEGLWGQAVGLHGAAVAAARQAGEPRWEAAALCELGRMRHAIGEYPASIEAHRAALAIFEELGDPHGQAEALWDLGRSEYVTGRYDEAITLLERGITQFHQADDRQGEAGALNDLGRVRLLTGDYRESADLQERALAIYEAIRDQQGEATTLRDLGRARFSNGDPTAAVALLERALEAYRDVGHRLGEASALHDLGHIHNETGDRAAAVSKYQEALVGFQELGNRQGEANTLWNMGRTRQDDGDYPAAVALFEEARTIYRSIGSKQGEAATLRDLGRTLHLTGDRTTAAAHYEEARAVYQAIGNRPGEIALLIHMGALVTESPGPREAEVLYRRALLLAREIQSPLDEARALEGTARCAAALGRRAEAVADMRQAVTLFRRMLAREADPAAAQLALWENEAAPPPDDGPGTGRPA